MPVGEKKSLALLISPQNYNSNHANGQTIRVDSIRKLLEAAGYEVLTIQLGRFAIHKVMHLILKYHPTIVAASSFIMSPALLGARILGALIWLDFTDSAVLTRSHASLPKKLYFKTIEQPCLNFVSQKAAIISHISALDRYSDSLNLSAKGFVFPNALDTPPKPYKNVNLARGVFIGDLNYEQNLDSARKLKKIEGKIGLDIQIFGNSNNVTIQRELRARYAESLREMYQVGDIHFCLSTSPAGIKNKVVNALSHGIPVISTSAGANGILSSSGLFVLNEDVDLEIEVQRILSNFNIADQEVLWRGFENDDSQELIAVLTQLKS